MIFDGKNNCPLRRLIEYNFPLIVAWLANDPNNNQKELELKLPGIALVPKNFTIMRVESRFVEAVRPDGLRVFFDLNEDAASRFLNQVRLSAPAEVVVRAVGAIRGFQISQNYARMHCGGSDGFLAAELELLMDAFRSQGWIEQQSALLV